MGKRAFRPASAEPAPRYPDLEEFDRSRRRFLTELGTAVLGLGSFGALLSACGDRAVDTDSSIRDRVPFKDSSGVKRDPDARGDAPPFIDSDAGPPPPDAGQPFDDALGGTAPLPDSRRDRYVPPPAPDGPEPTDPDGGETD
jgi:hypothetical protein